ncbi:MAG: hypothetical protein R6U46_09720 [Marinilabilia sp.]
MLTQNSKPTRAQLQKELNDPSTDFLIIHSQDGMVMVNKKDSTVFILPNEGPPKVLSPGLYN